MGEFKYNGSGMHKLKKKSNEKYVYLGKGKRYLPNHIRFINAIKKYKKRGTWPVGYRTKVERAKKLHWCSKDYKPLIRGMLADLKRYKRKLKEEADKLRKEIRENQEFKIVNHRKVPLDSNRQQIQIDRPLPTLQKKDQK